MRHSGLRALSLATAAVLVLGVAGCSDDSADPTPTSRTTATDSPGDTGSPSGPASSATTEPAGEATDEAGSTVPVYFAGETPDGPRLFREFRRVDGNPLQEAAALAVAGDALDPDYRTLWPGVEIALVEATDGVLLVRLADDGFTERPDGMSGAEARLALQQLVYTLQGVQQERVPVQFLREAGPSRLFGIDIEGPVTQTPPEDALALVNVTSPEQGGVVSGDLLEASGVANSFEATVPWQILRDGEVVLEGFATADGWMDKLYPWRTEIDVSSLAPGDYTFVAATDDPSGGAEGSGPTRDSKDFALR